MLQDNAQNELFSSELLEVWFDWLSKNASQAQDTSDTVRDKITADADIPESVLAMLQCIVGLGSIVGSTSIDRSKVQKCLENLNKNQKEVADFFQRLQDNPSTLISLMQKLGRPLPLPVKDLIRALEEVSNDKTAAVSGLRKALLNYLELMKLQQNQLIILMQDSVETVSEKITNSSIGFIDAWVQEFELKYSQLAKQDEYSRNLGKLINASVQVLKEQQLYRDYQRNN